MFGLATKEKKEVKFLFAILGCLFYSIGMNWFIIPEHLYSGGLMGVCQLISYVITDICKVKIASFDFTGLILYAFNVPILIWAWKSLGKKFVVKSIACATALSLFLSILPIPSIPILEEDILGSCIIGGLVCGVGMGLTLSVGSSMGGLDIIGLILTSRKKASSIGNLYLAVNVFVYAVCLFLFDIKVVIYSLIVAAITSFALDKMHLQNINVEVKVITKNLCKDMQDEIMQSMYRGITRWEGKGAYTEEDEYVFYILMSKYEVQKLRNIVQKYDPNAWIVINENVSVFGNFVKKL